MPLPVANFPLVRLFGTDLLARPLGPALLQLLSGEFMSLLPNRAWDRAWGQSQQECGGG